MRRDEESLLDYRNNKKLSYIRELYSVEDNLLKDIRNDCFMDNRPITINPEEGKLLQLIIKTSNIKTIIEIGTLQGYSTIWFARALPKNGKIYTIEKEDYNFHKAKRNFNKLENELEKNIISINGNGIDELEKLIEQNIQCDMIFIDADKSNYFNYLKLSEKLVKKGGLIVADNTFLSGGVYSNYLPDRVTLTTQKIMRQFNKELSNSTKYESIMLNTEEGLSIAIKL